VTNQLYTHTLTHTYKYIYYIERHNNNNILVQTRRHIVRETNRNLRAFDFHSPMCNVPRTMIYYIHTNRQIYLYSYIYIPTIYYIPAYTGREFEWCIEGREEPYFAMLRCRRNSIFFSTFVSSGLLYSNIHT